VDVNEGGSSVNVNKHVAGSVLFILIVSLSIFIASTLTAPLLTIPPLPLTAQPSVVKTTAELVSYHVPLVSLDFINRQSYTTLQLKRKDNQPAPRKLWVYTLFYATDYSRKSWSSGALEIGAPFAAGDETTLTATGDCAWCGNADAPRDGYYASVGVSTLSGEDAAGRALEAAQNSLPLQVLVQVERKQRR
jgi:hypothetical protein